MIHDDAALRDEGAILDLLVAALPHLRGGLRSESARFTAQLLHDHLGLDAAAVVSPDAVLAYVGAGSDHHLVGGPNLTDLTARTMLSGNPYTARDRKEIGCPEPSCPLTAVVIAPLIVRGNVVGAFKLYRTNGRPIREREEKVAFGLARVFSVYLEVAELDARSALVTRAELDALRAQISPHFLFNTLTTIAALTRTNPARAHDLIVDFADFFRETLANHGEFVTLDDEMINVERYLRFEEARFGERLQTTFAIEPRARLALVPVLVVQPLVENAIAHGLAPRNGLGTVRVAAHAFEGGYEIAVTDDGVGIADEIRAQLLERGAGNGNGVGLNNVHERLIGLFGPHSGLRISSSRDAGTTVAFWVPPTPANA
jgi:LytS/YehU family sensor histidine kinase